MESYRFEQDEVDTVIQEAVRWGVTVETALNWKQFYKKEYGFRHEHPNQNLSFAPFCDTICIDWKDRKIFLDHRLMDDKNRRLKDRDLLLPFSMIHELAHIIQGRDPKEVDEINSGMLAFEWSTARQLGLPAHGYFAWMDEYGADCVGGDGDCGGGNWNTHTPACQTRILRGSFRAARKKNILKKDWTPTYNRRRK